MTQSLAIQSLAKKLIEEIKSDALDLWFFKISLEHHGIMPSADNLMLLIRHVLADQQIYMIMRNAYDNYITFTGHERDVTSNIELFMKSVDIKNLISDDTAYFSTSEGLDSSNARNESRIVKFVIV